MGILNKCSNHILFACLAAIIFSCNPEPSYLITGELEGAEGKTIYLQKREGGNWLKMDSVIITNDFFQFAGKVNYPSAHYLRIEGKRGYRMFLLENSDIIVTGSADTLYNLEIAGSVSNAEYEVYSREIEDLFDFSSDLFDQQHMAIEKGDSLVEERISRERTALHRAMIDYQVEFVRNNTGSFATPLVLRSLSASLNAKELRELIELLVPDLLRTDIVKSLMATIDLMEQLVPGNPAPEFGQADNNGNLVNLSEITGEGPVIIYFWASWCSACRSLNTSLIELYEKYRDTGMIIIAVSLDSSNDEWTGAIADDRLDWINLSDLNGWNNEVALLYNINEIPAVYMLDSEGRILESGLDTGRLDEILARSSAN